MRCRQRGVSLFRSARLEPLEQRALLAFGLTTTTSAYTVDSGAGLVFSVIRGGTISSTVHLGDMTSAKLNGTEALASFSSTSRYSHYESGLGSSTKMSATVDPSADPQWIVITCDDSASSGVIQYYIAKKNDPNIYMASMVTDLTKTPGEGRYIAYLNKSVFTNIEQPSNIAGNDGAVEGSDVFHFPDGTTASKFYNMGRRIIDHVYHGVTGAGAGAFMFMGNRERSSGGPFFKDIDFQTTSGATEMYNYTFSGHTQTEAYRGGLYGPYALQLTDGSQPTMPDYSFIESVGLSGYVGTAGRGSVSGTASGFLSGHQTVVALSNTAAQYWAYADSTTGAFTINGVLPGTYTMTMYDTELAIGTRTITVAAQATTAADIVNTYAIPDAIWRIGTWDGTPAGFLNADKISIMHPSDVRMSSWTSTPNFVIGTNTDADWPLAEFKSGVNNGERISFNLTAEQAAQAMTLRIGITLGFAGGRDQIVVNAGQSNTWTSSIPSASTNLNSRGITRGTWRGPNQLYTYNIPVSALLVGLNTIDLNVVSGSSGSGFLSPNIVYDAIDLIPTTTLTNVPKVQSITLTPSMADAISGTQVGFVAHALDQFGNPIAANFDFSTSAGAINPSGIFTAPFMSGIDTITAKSGGVSTTAQVTVTNPYPRIATDASALPSVVTGTTSDLSVLGDSDNGEADLAYTWSTLTAPLGTNPVFSSNGDNASKNTTVTFDHAGSYTFQVTVTTSLNYTMSTTVSLTVEQTPSNLLIDPPAPSIAVGQSQQFSASEVDQFGDDVGSPVVTWSITGASNFITSGGLAIIGNKPGSYIVSAAGDSLINSTTITVTPPVYIVTTTADSGPGSLRQAILNANVGVPLPGSFNFFVSGVVQLASQLPNLNYAETLNLAAGNVTVGTGSGFTFGEFPSLTILGGGRLSLGGSQSHVSPAAIIVSAGGLTLNSDAGVNISLTTSAPVTFAASQHLASLVLNGAAAALPGSGKMLAVDSLSLLSGASLDLAGNEMIVHTQPGTQPSVLASLINWLHTGFGPRTWNGPGINSSTASANLARTTAIGLMANALGNLPRMKTFGGESAAATDLLLKYTYCGDANLDGIVNGADYAWLDNGKNFSLKGFGNGDFNYDGAVNSLDYALIDEVLTFQSAPLSSTTLQPLALSLPSTANSATNADVSDQALAGYLTSSAYNAASASWNLLSPSDKAKSRI